MVMTPIIEPDYGALLNAARSKYHELMIGEVARVYVDQNGERVEYTVANSSRLAMYIAMLERRLGVGCPLGPMRTFM